MSQALPKGAPRKAERHGAPAYREVRMPILKITRRHIDREMYNAIDELVDIEHRHPPGLIMHGVIERGRTVEVAQVWDSDHDAQRFVEDVLTPALQEAGAPLDADVTVFELHHLVTP